jgi:archaeosine synthase beta-subunit
MTTPSELDSAETNPYPELLAAKVRHLYAEFGQRKAIGESAADRRRPHYFLLRTFRGDNDLLIIFNTKRCRYHCAFCRLPEKSSREFIPASDIAAQFEYVSDELKHALSIVDRVTFSNEGSILDNETLPTETLIQLTEAVAELRRVTRLVLETRIEFVDPVMLRRLAEVAPRVMLTILIGFETRDPTIRQKVLVKQETLRVVEGGLDKIAAIGAQLGAYVLFKPSPRMSDEEAYQEADESIDYIVAQCAQRGIRIDCIRLNPMYLARGSAWARLAERSSAYRPPRLTDLMRLAEKKSQAGIPIYIGLSTEGLADFEGTYLSREDYTPKLIRPIKLFNDGRLASFAGIV